MIPYINESSNEVTLNLQWHYSNDLSVVAFFDVEIQTATISRHRRTHQETQVQIIIPYNRYSTNYSAIITAFGHCKDSPAKAQTYFYGNNLIMMSEGYSTSFLCTSVRPSVILIFLLSICLVTFLSLIPMVSCVWFLSFFFCQTYKLTAIHPYVYVKTWCRIIKLLALKYQWVSNIAPRVCTWCIFSVILILLSFSDMLDINDRDRGNVKILACTI